MYIEIGSFALRDWESGDAPRLARFANNPKIAANLRDGFPHPYRLEDAEAFLEKVCAAERRTVFAIAERRGAIGSIGLVPGQDVHRFTAELGYWLAEPYWGRGIMTRAVRAIADWGFEVFDLHRIHADLFEGNDASERVLVKAGFVLESRARASAVKLGTVRDQLIYVRLREGVYAGLRVSDGE